MDSPRDDPAFMASLTPAMLKVFEEMDLDKMLSGRMRYHTYEPDGPVLKAFYQDWKPFTSIIGPVGSGKTAAAIQKCRDIICDMPVDNTGVRRSTGIVIRNVEADLKRATIPDWLKVMKGLGKMVYSSPIQHHIHFIGMDGIEVICTVNFIALDNEEKAIERIRGINATWAFIDEARFIKQNVVSETIARLGRAPSQIDVPDPEGWDGISDKYWWGAVMSSNPPSEDHWLAQVHEDPTLDQEVEWGTYNQPGGVRRNVKSKGWEVNPNAENLKALSPTYYRKLLAAASREAHISINLGANYGVEVKGVPVWQEYNSEVHETVDFDYDPNLPVYIGIDYGRTPAATLGQEQGGGYLFFDEFITSDVGAPQFADALAIYLAKMWGIQARNVIGWDDPSGSNPHENGGADLTAHNILTAKGFRLAKAPCGNNNMTIRRKAMLDPLTQIRMDGKPRVLMHKRCRFLCKGAAGKFYYRKLQVTGEEQHTEKPEKNMWSHVCESAEYLLVGLGEGQVYQGHDTKLGYQRATTRVVSRHN